LWYDPQIYKKLAEALEEDLHKLRPESDNYFKEQAKAFEAKLDKLLHKIEQAKGHLAGKKFAATESVANYLAKALGLEDATPESYANAIANEGEPTATDVAAMHSILESKQVQFLFYNTQEENNLTKELLQDAQKSGVKVIEVSEQCPSKFTDTLEWLTSVIDSIN
jgi:zinc/manganese transport system substrate-binding protein